MRDSLGEIHNKKRQYNPSNRKTTAHTLLLDHHSQQHVLSTRHQFHHSRTFSSPSTREIRLHDPPAQFQKPLFPRFHPSNPLNSQIRGDKITISVDCGFQSTRGYRQHLAETPLKETIAAARTCSAVLANSLLWFGSKGIIAPKQHVDVRFLLWIGRTRRRNAQSASKRLSLSAEKAAAQGVSTWVGMDMMWRAGSNSGRVTTDRVLRVSWKAWKRRNRARDRWCVGNGDLELIAGDYAILSSDIAERAIFCSNQNMRNVLRLDASQKVEEVVIPKVETENLR